MESEIEILFRISSPFYDASFDTVKIGINTSKKLEHFKK